MAETEIVYLGSYDNTNDFQLQSDGVAIDLSSVTNINANINGVDVLSTNQSNDLIRWDQVGYATGEIRCKFSSVSGLTDGGADCYFIVIDPTNTNGVVFGPITLYMLTLP